MAASDRPPFRRQGFASNSKDEVVSPTLGRTLRGYEPANLRPRLLRPAKIICFCTCLARKSEQFKINRFRMSQAAVFGTSNATRLRPWKEN